MVKIWFKFNCKHLNSSGPHDKSSCSCWSRHDIPENVNLFLQVSFHKQTTRVYFARDYIFFKGPNNVIGLYWRLKFEWEQLLWFFLGSCRVLVYVFFQTCMARVFSNRHNSHNKHIKFKKFGGKIAQLLCLDLYKYKISRQIDSSHSQSNCTRISS